MKVLVCSSNYSPELTGVGKYTGEMARWLASRGHEVRVVTAPPHYPDWTVPVGYSGWRWSRRVEEGVVVWRCPTYIPARPGGVRRLLHLISFALGSLPVMLRHVFWKPDVVWVVEPPLLSAPTAALVARLAGALSWLHVQDFEVDAAFELGLLKGRRTKAMALGFERWLLGRFTVVSTISGRMLDTLKSKGVPEDRIRSLPNWADINMFDDVTPEEVSLLRSRLNIPPGARVALYSGNMGRKQGLEVLAQVAASFPVHESVAAEVCFVFCGNGVGRAELEAACSGLGNVRFSDLLPSAEFPVLLQLADIHLLPQVAQASDLVMPSKLTAILASGRPVVASAVPGSELARVASMAGIVVDPQDSGAMVAAVMRLVTGDALRIQLGDAGRQFALAHLGRDHILMQFEGDLLRLREASTD